LGYLSANNQVVGQVASMYQYFGLFITIIVSLVGILAVALGFFARRSVNAFVQEWGRKLEALDRDMKESLNRLHEAVSMAEASANKAAKHARSIEDSKTILNKTLEEVDRLRASVVSLHDQVRGEAASAAAPIQTAEAEAAQPPPEPSGEDEDAEVAARLKGKIDSAGEEG
jgi:uncharacterized membrane protein